MDKEDPNKKLRDWYRKKCLKDKVSKCMAIFVVSIPVVVMIAMFCLAVWFAYLKYAALFKYVYG